MYIVGLTGGIGSGKSTIAHYFAQLGVPLIDADHIARQVVEPGSPLLEQIQAHFGDTVLTAQGELNRAVLREKVFHHREERTWLNALLHPAIRAEMLAQTERLATPYVMWVVPLLIENGLNSLCQRVLVVDVPPEVQLERTIARDQSQADTIKQIMRAQVSRETRLSYADDVIDNRRPLSEAEPFLRQQVATLHQQYCRLAHTFSPLPIIHEEQS